MIDAGPARGFPEKSRGRPGNRKGKAPGWRAPLWMLLLGGASAPAQPPAVLATLRDWLTSPPGPSSEAHFEALKEDFATADAAEAAVRQLRESRTALAPGFHRLTITGVDPPVYAGVVVPRGAVPPGGHPLLLAPAPAMLHPPDELVLRARYGTWLDLGWVVLSPLPPVYQIHGQYVPKRDPWSDGPDHLALYVAAIDLDHPIDRDRVLLHSRPPEGNPDSTDEVPVFAGDTTPLAGFLHFVPGTRRPAPVPDPLVWNRRLLALHLSTHADDLARIQHLGLEQRAAGAGFRFWSRFDAGLDFPSRLAIDAAAMAEVAARAVRGGAPARLEFLAGGKGPARFEWLSAPGLAAPLRLVAALDGSSIRVATPDEPDRAPFALDLHLPDAPAAVTLEVNGRPAFGGPVPHGVREALEAARSELQGGRPVRRLLSVRP